MFLSISDVSIHTCLAVQSTSSKKLLFKKVDISTSIIVTNCGKCSNPFNKFSNFFSEMRAICFHILEQKLHENENITTRNLKKLTTT